MSSIINADKAAIADTEARFLAKVKLTLDSSLSDLPDGVERQLNAARNCALERVRLPDAANLDLGKGVASALDASEQQIPQPVRLRLDAMRAQALQRASAKLHKVGAFEVAERWWQRWTPQSIAVPASAFASLCIFVTTLALFSLPETQETMPLAVAENTLVLASEDEIELYENLEFYQWLADNGL